MHSLIIVVAFQGIARDSSTNVLDKLKSLSIRLKLELMILIDIGYLDKGSFECYLKFVCDVVANCDQSRVFIAATSGDGGFSQSRTWNQLHTLTRKFKPQCLYNQHARITFQYTRIIFRIKADSVSLDILCTLVAGYIGNHKFFASREHINS